MSASREPIFELAEKIDCMTEALFRREVIPQPSRTAFAEACGIKPKTLASSCVAGGLSINHQKLITGVVEFEREHSSWIDRNIPAKKRHHKQLAFPRRDTSLHFRNYLFPLLGLSGLPRYALVPLTPTTPAPEIAAVALTDYGQTTPEGSDIHVHLQASVRVGYLDDGFAYGFKEFRVRVQFAPGKIVRIPVRLAENGPQELDGVSVHCQGTAMDPQWRFSIKNEPLNREILTSDDPLFTIRPSELPATMTAKLALHPHDGSLAAVPPRKMTTENKARIVERLMLKLLTDKFEEDGSFLMSSQEIGIAHIENE